MSLSINTNIMANNAARNLSSHYGDLANSIQRLSSGLRVNSSADDAAGLSIREMMRADIAALNQGVRNVNDAISMVQTADGALGIIDEKLIRMKELAEQAATGTYSSDQRLMIDSEFQAMASEIERIARSTRFNGIYLLNGNLSGAHDGSGLQSTGSAKIHFGPTNNAAEDYYYISGGDATIKGLGLAPDEVPINENVAILSEKLENGVTKASETSGIVSFAVIPKGTKNLIVEINDRGQNDSIQVFTRNGTHVAGTALNTYNDWSHPKNGITSAALMEEKVLTEDNGFTGNTYDAKKLNGKGGNLDYNDEDPYNQFTYGGMNLAYSGCGNAAGEYSEFFTLDEATEDLVILVVGGGYFDITATWGYMPDKPEQIELPLSISIQTQEQAQQALERIDDALVKKDSIRAHLGAMQNRLENTASNLMIQAENLQASESRISDVDVAQEMTGFIRGQILTQSATAMLSQANSLPQMALQLIQG